MREVQLPLPRPSDRDGRSDLNFFSGLPDRTIRQVPRGPEANRFAGRAGDESLKLGDRDWRETMEIPEPVC